MQKFNLTSEWQSISKNIVNITTISVQVKKTNMEEQCHVNSCTVGKHCLHTLKSIKILFFFPFIKLDCYTK